MATTSAPVHDDTPSSPTFVKHTTTDATSTHPFIDTTVAPINAAPVELDSTPVDSVSPVERKESWKVKGDRTSATISPDLDEEIYGELNGEKGGNGVSREKRKELLAARSKDPAVLVDLPQTPRAEEYEVAAVRNIGALGKIGDGATAAAKTS